MGVVKKSYTGPRVKDTETFLLKARWRHGDRYDYSEVRYTASDKEVEIICGVHGSFKQRANCHLQGKGCKKCQYEGNSKKLKFTKEKFVEKSVEAHGNKYDYSKVEYVNKENKVCIICPEHGEFWQRAGGHMQGKGCNKCKYVLHAKQTALPSGEVIRRAKEVHGDLYTYPEQDIENNSSKLKIVCSKHGLFHQNASNHIRFGHGCPKCKGEKHAERRSFDLGIFLDKAVETHGDKYDYSRVVYENSNKPVEILCKKHGAFYQTPHSHWSGTNCPKCSQEMLTENQRYNLQIFIDKSIDVHGDKYTYDDAEYVDSVTKVVIGCPDHGTFRMTPSSHWQGQGCSECANLRRGFGRSAIYKSFEECSHIYLIRLYNEKENFIKVGLARKPNIRHARIKKESDYEIEVLRCHSGSGIQVFDLEKSILSNKDLEKYVPDQKFQGYTECFSVDSYEIIDELMEVCFDL